MRVSILASVVAGAAAFGSTNVAFEDVPFPLGGAPVNTYTDDTCSDTVTFGDMCWVSGDGTTEMVACGPDGELYHFNCWDCPASSASPEVTSQAIIDNCNTGEIDIMDFGGDECIWGDDEWMAASCPV